MKSPISSSNEDINVLEAMTHVTRSAPIHIAWADRLRPGQAIETKVINLEQVV